MGIVGVGFSMSLDGFIADENDGVNEVFAWMFQGDTVLPTAGEDFGLKMDATSAEQMEQITQRLGVVVSGRRTFNTAGAWGGTHPMNVPVVVLTHSIPEEWANHPTFTFVAEGGVERAIAIAQEIAGDKMIGVAGANITQQCIKAGLIDEIGIDLVPVLLGKGVRLFEATGVEPLQLTIKGVTPTPNVTHLMYSVNK